MAVAGVMLQLVGQRRPQAAGIVPAEAHADGDAVCHGEFHTVLGAAEDIGVVPQALHGRVAVGALQGHGQIHRQVVPRQELHDLPQTRQRPERLGQLLRPFRRDALDAL